MTKEDFTLIKCPECLASRAYMNKILSMKEEFNPVDCNDCGKEFLIMREIKPTYTGVKANETNT